MEIQLLTQDDCRFCDDAKEILERVGREHGFSVRTIELTSEEGQRLATRGGVMFAPGVLIDGEPFSYGRLSERRLRRELEKRGSAIRHR